MTSANFPEDQLTQNAFLGGRLQIFQPKKGYRAGLDPVLLAASVPAKPGQSVLELGCGAGVAALCLAQRVADLNVTGIELQAGYADLARKNAQENGLGLWVHTCAIDSLPAEVKSQRFDHVIANPPYFETGDGTKPSDHGRTLGRQGGSLGLWVSVAAKRLAPKGCVTFIQSAQRLPELVGQFSQHFKNLSILPIAPRVGKNAKLVIIQGRKEGRAQTNLLSPLILHDGPEHVADGDDYSQEASEILRIGAELKALN